jgi:hypothetical protein
VTFKQHQRIPRPISGGRRSAPGYAKRGSFRSAGSSMPPSARPPRPPRREPDPFGFVARRETAWTEWRTNPTPGHAYEFARLSGYCLTTGSGLPFLPLPVPVVALAGRELTGRLTAWRQGATALADADGPKLAELLEGRTDAWAVMEAIRRTEAELRDAGDRDALLVTRAFEPLFELLDGFDATLEVHAEAVREFARGERAKALREMLSPRFRMPLPWWLEV